jgi:hypothetical protein
MARGEAKQEEEFNSSMDTSMEDASPEDAREARRLRREQRNQEEDDPSLLDVSDDQEERGLPITRVSTRRDEAAEAAMVAEPAMSHLCLVSPVLQVLSLSLWLSYLILYMSISHPHPYISLASRKTAKLSCREGGNDPKRSGV